MLLADEVLSPTTMLMPTGRPRKQARTQGPAAMGVASAEGASAGRRPGSGNSQLQRSSTPGARAFPDGAANMAQSEAMQQQMMQSMMLQQGQQQGMSALGPLSSAGELQQAGHRPVVLACQLVLQQQANPTALRPLFEAPASSSNPMQHKQDNMPGLAASAELVNSALQLAQAGSGGNAQTHLDQLKAVTMSAQAAAATASAVAAATALLWQQLQQQEQARARQHEHEHQEEPRQEVLPAQADAEPAAGQEVGAAVEPAPPGSPAADPAVVGQHQGESGSISRSSSSSTSAAGLSNAPGNSHSVDKPPAEQSAPAEHQEQGPRRATPVPTGVADPAGLAPVPSTGFDLPAASPGLASNAGAEFDSSTGASLMQLMSGPGNH
jgi:hypothetical protein